MSESGGEPREGVRGRGRKRRGDWRTKHLRACLLCGRVWRPGRRRTCPVHVRSICLTCDQVRGPRAAPQTRRCAAWSRPAPALGAGAPSARCGRRPRPPRPRARRAGRVREARQRARWSTMLSTARASLETRRNGRAGIPRRVPAVGRSVDEVDARAPRRRPRPACDPRAPSADVRRCRTSSRSRSPLGLEPRCSYGYTASYFSDRRPRAASATGAVFRHLRRGTGASRLHCAAVT